MSIKTKITSTTNEKIKKLVLLKTKKGRDLYNEFLIETKHLIEEALSLNIEVDIYTTDESYKGTLVTNEVMKKICNTTTPTSYVGVVKYLTESSMPTSNKLLILDKVQDPSNMGSIFRSAVAFGFTDILISDDSVDKYNDKVVRTSQGAIFKLNFINENVIKFLNAIKNDFKVYSTDVSKGNDIRIVKMKKDDKIAVIFGNEGNGISDEIKDLNFDNLHISISNTESLNVSVASAIIMYEISKLV
ncbi:MAG: TrmH family RNA methyltransferase [Anaeroplasmataceae bacterium]